MNTIRLIKIALNCINLVSVMRLLAEGTFMAHMAVISLAVRLDSYISETDVTQVINSHFQGKTRMAFSQ